jgi:hypothetical protein
VLAQNRGGQAEIVTLIERFRVRHAPDPTQPLSRARAAARHQYERLVAAVEWKLIEMPLPRLQVIGDTENRFLYRIGWDASVTRQHLGDSGFDNRIQLLDGVADSLVQLSGLLRPLIQRAWAGMVAGMNRDATDEARLQEFLFGAQRISLDPVRAELRELQGNRCFYCDGRIAGPADVDHFIPWARHPDNGIENLVVADPRCNGNKRDFLAAGEHVERWTQRSAGCVQRASTSAYSPATCSPVRVMGWRCHCTRCSARANCAACSGASSARRRSSCLRLSGSHSARSKCGRCGRLATRV